MGACDMRRLFLLAVCVCSLVARADSFSLYAEGKEKEAFEEIIKELREPKKPRDTKLSLIQMGRSIFTQQDSMKPADLSRLYAAAIEGKLGGMLESRIGFEKKYAEKFFDRFDKFTLKDADAEFKAVLAMSVNTARSERSARNAALALVLHRKARAEAGEPEWLYALAKSEDLDANSGHPFYFEYLEHPKTKMSSKVTESLAMIQKQLQLDYKGQIPLEETDRVNTIKKRFKVK
jgi:hypothetical protein